MGIKLEPGNVYYIPFGKFLLDGVESKKLKFIFVLDVVGKEMISALSVELDEEFSPISSKIDVCLEEGSLLFKNKLWVVCSEIYNLNTSWFRSGDIWIVGTL